MKWRAIADSSAIRNWGDEYVVYNPRSGNSHLLGYVAGQILLKLQQAPMDAAGLLDKLPIDWQLDADQDVTEQIDALLADLGSLALIERA
ncbi:MAG: HPr-rel-A system PqqD family peptide chaperone [Pseudomonadota bacterium]